MADERTGITPITKVKLKPGLNSFVAVVNYDALPASVPQAAEQYVAQWLATALGVTGTYIGQDPTGMTNARIYVIGEGEPVHIWQIGATERRNAWYQRMGMPQGPRVVYVALSIDWRGPERTIEAPTKFVSIPLEPHVIDNNWPRGDAAEQKRLLEEARSSAMQADFATWSRSANRALDTYLNSLGDYLVPDIIPGAGTTLNLGIILAVIGAGAYLYSQARAGKL